MKSRQCTKLIMLAFAIIQSAAGFSQTRSGAGFLKMQPGARETSSPAISTTGLTHIHGFYANPAVTAFAREWQWGASYSRWIADLYTTSIVATHRLRIPFCSNLRAAFGLNYMGIPEFNSADRALETVSGGDMRITAGVGQVISIGEHYAGFGMNATFFRSQLANYVSKTSAFDFGVLFRTRRYAIGLQTHRWMEYAIFTAGLAVNNLGPPLTFLSEGTPLPRLIKAGMGIYMGTHQGFQWTVGGDVQKVLDDNPFLRLSSEISWNQTFALQFGYNFDESILGNITFGGSITLSDKFLHNVLGRANACQIDLGANEANPIFVSPYYGSLSAYPVLPGSFRLIAPAMGSLLHVNSVKFEWEPTADPDLFDDVAYRLYISRDSTNIIEIANNADRLKIDNSTIPAVHITTKHEMSIDFLPAAHYYWTVLAIDKDGHARSSKHQGRSYSTFTISQAKLKLQDVKLAYSPWIRQDDHQGVISFEIINQGDRIAKNVVLSFADSTTSSAESQHIRIADSLAPDSSVHANINWNTAFPGEHRLYFKVASKIDSTCLTDRFSQRAFTIPKGFLVTDDTVHVLKLNAMIYELPYIGKIYFDANSSAIDPMYISDWVAEPALVTFARRLRMNPRIKIHLQGTIDPNSGETDPMLASRRARSVADTLMQLGVPEKQLIMDPGIVLKKRPVPTKPQDAKWVFEERRRVDITTEIKFEEGLFAPLETTYYEQLPVAIRFDTKIKAAVPMQEGTLLWKNDNTADSLLLDDYFPELNLQQPIVWNLNYSTEDLENNWIRHFFSYTLTITDSLGRSFSTPTQYTFATKDEVQLERQYYVIARFAEAKPFYQFYWENLLERLPLLLDDKQKRIKFIGHGCAIGSNDVNKRLSDERALTFQDIFLKDVSYKYPDIYNRLLDRLDPAEGMGEDEPIRFKTSTGRDVILGNNNLPVGRQLNRRVMVRFYIAADSLQNSSK